MLIGTLAAARPLNPVYSPARGSEGVAAALVAERPVNAAALAYREGSGAPRRAAVHAVALGGRSRAAADIQARAARAGRHRTAAVCITSDRALSEHLRRRPGGAAARPSEHPHRDPGATARSEAHHSSGRKRVWLGRSILHLSKRGMRVDAVRAGTVEAAVSAVLRRASASDQQCAAGVLRQLAEALTSNVDDAPDHDHWPRRRETPSASPHVPRRRPSKK